MNQAPSIENGVELTEKYLHPFARIVDSFISVDAVHLFHLLFGQGEAE